MSSIKIIEHVVHKGSALADFLLSLQSFCVTTVGQKGVLQYAEETTLIYEIKSLLCISLNCC